MCAQVLGSYVPGSLMPWVLGFSILRTLLSQVLCSQAHVCQVLESYIPTTLSSQVLGSYCPRTMCAQVVGSYAPRTLAQGSWVLCSHPLALKFHGPMLLVPIK